MCYYNKSCPNVNDIVFVKIKEFTTDGIYFNLVEYNNLEGYVLNTELGKSETVETNGKDKKGKYIHWFREKYFREDCVYAMIVDKVSNDIISLSYQRLNHKDKNMLEEQYSYAERIYRLVEEFSVITGDNFEYVLDYSMRNLFDPDANNMMDFKDIHDSILADPLVLFGELLNRCSDVQDTCVYNEFLKQLNLRIKRKNSRLSQEINLKVYCDNAITTIKSIFEDLDIEYVTAPKYKININSFVTENECNDELQRILEIIQNRITTITNDVEFSLGEKEFTTGDMTLKYLTKKDKGEDF